MLVPLPQTNGPVQDVIPGLIREGPGAGLILERWDPATSILRGLIQLAMQITSTVKSMTSTAANPGSAISEDIITAPDGTVPGRASFVLRSPCGAPCWICPEFLRLRGRRTHYANLRRARIQGHGLGRRLMEASLQALRFRRYSLGVTHVTSGMNVRCVCTNGWDSIRSKNSPQGFGPGLPVKIC